MSDEDPENAKHEFAFDNPAFKGNLQIIQFSLALFPPSPPPFGWKMTAIKRYIRIFLDNKWCFARESSQERENTSKKKERIQRVDRKGNLDNILGLAETSLACKPKQNNISCPNNAGVWLFEW